MVQKYGKMIALLLKLLRMLQKWGIKGETALPNQKLACFVLYLKIINTFLKNNICIL